MAVDIQAAGALRLIEKAYERELVDCTLEDVKGLMEEFAKPLDFLLDRARQNRRPLDRAERAMAFFANHWGEEEDEESTEDLLEVLKNRRQMPSVTGIQDVGRNDLCPCGSGRKFKKCCMGKPAMQKAEPIPLNGGLIQEGHRLVDDWMEAGYAYDAIGIRHPWKVFECWKNCWEEMRFWLPPALLDPSRVAVTGVCEEGGDLLDWLQDFQALLVELSEQSFDVAEYSVKFFREILDRFPAMDGETRREIKADCARCLALLGKHKEARSLAEEMIAEAPGKTQGYALLAEMCGDDAAIYNIKQDVPGAIRHLQNALDRADDCEDFDIEKWLADLVELKKSQEAPM